MPREGGLLAREVKDRDYNHRSKGCSKRICWGLCYFILDLMEAEIIQRANSRIGDIDYRSSQVRCETL